MIFPASQVLNFSHKHLIKRSDSQGRQQTNWCPTKIEPANKSRDRVAAVYFRRRFTPTTVWVLFESPEAPVNGWNCFRAAVKGRWWRKDQDKISVQKWFWIQLYLIHLHLQNMGKIYSSHALPDKIPFPPLPPSLDLALKMLAGTLVSFWDGLFSGSERSQPSSPSPSQNSAPESLFLAAQMPRPRHHQDDDLHF